MPHSIASKKLQERDPTKDSSSPRLPHERDESDDSQSGDSQNTGKRDVIKKAHDDIESGQKDTDLHGTPGLDKPVK